MQNSLASADSSMPALYDIPPPPKRYLPVCRLPCERRARVRAICAAARSDERRAECILSPVASGHFVTPAVGAITPLREKSVTCGVPADMTILCAKEYGELISLVAINER